MDSDQWHAEVQRNIERLLDDIEHQPTRAKFDELGDILSQTPVRGPLLSAEQLSRLTRLVAPHRCHGDLAGPGLTRCLLTVALHASFDGRHEDAIRHGTEAVKQARLAGNPLFVARATKCITLYYAHVGRFRDAIALSAEALASLPREGPEANKERAGIILNAGIFYFWLGHYARASRLVRYALRLAQRKALGPRLLCILNTNLACMLLTAGEYRRGIEIATAAVEFCRQCYQAGEAFQLELAYYYLARLQIEVGLLEEAKATLAEASARFPTSGFGDGGLLAIARGLAAVQEGDVREGLRLIESGVAADIKRWPYATFTEAMLAAARGYELAGLHDEARDRVERVIAYLYKLRFEGPHGPRATAHDSGDVLGLLQDRRRALRERRALAPARTLTMKLEELAAQAECHEYQCFKHPLRVGRLSYLIAKRLGMGHDDAAAVMVGGKLHDIGKCALPPPLLLSTTPLSQSQAEALRTHTIIGEQLLRDAPESGFTVPAAVARSHHERWDGTGYPDGLRGEEIPLAARIVAVAEAFDAMTHDRPGRPARSAASALAELVRQAGRQFDPRVVAAAASCIEGLQESASGIDAQLEHDGELAWPQTPAGSCVRSTGKAEALAG